MTIKLEIHAPGLDLHHERWNHHVLFMDSVHKHAERVSACAWQTYQEQGRGALFIDKERWMTIIKGDGWTDTTLFPCTHVDARDSEKVDAGPLRAGFVQMIAEYDPEREAVLLVEHHPGAQLSSYLMGPDLRPPEAAEKFRHLADPSPA